jgi:hypothetical protein
LQLELSQLLQLELLQLSQLELLQSGLSQLQSGPSQELQLEPLLPGSGMFALGFCPFKHWSRYVMQMTSETNAAAPTRSDTGRAVHEGDPDSMHATTSVTLRSASTQSTLAFCGADLTHAHSSFALWKEGSAGSWAHELLLAQTHVASTSAAHALTEFGRS